MAPMPVTEALQMSHIGSLTNTSIGHNIGILHAKALIISMHLSWSGLQWNVCVSLHKLAKGPVYMDRSGMNCLMYCTNLRNLCTLLTLLGIGFYPFYPQ